MTHPASDSVAAGDLVDVLVGDVASGGWCVARSDAHTGLVVFVRHALPGERVRARITQTTATFARADAVEIVSAAAERVPAPCPYARPGGCGGCDWQHASPAFQRALKSRVITQQLRRIAGIDRKVTVAELPGHPAGLGWRTRVRFAVGTNGRAGLYRHRSHEIVGISDCLIAHPLIREVGVTRRRWPGARWVDVAAAPGTGQRAVMTHENHGPGTEGRFLTQRAAGRDWRVSARGFWQVHPAAADALAQAVLTGLRPAKGEVALDLFCGAGLFAGLLADAVGPDGLVVGVERDAAAVHDARHNLRSTPWARVHCGDAGELLASSGTFGASVAVVDPPRTGLSRALIDALSATHTRGDTVLPWGLCPPGTPRTPMAPPPDPHGPEPPGRQPSVLRRVAYVSCDPATLARDIAMFGERDWRLADIQGFDAFPMTHHVECVAILEPPR